MTFYSRFMHNIYMIYSACLCVLLEGFPALLKGHFQPTSARKCGIVQEMWDSLQQNKEKEFPVCSVFLFVRS